MKPESAFSITFPSVEAALAQLGENVFGARIVIQTPEDTPQKEEITDRGTPLPPPPDGFRWESQGKDGNAKRGETYVSLMHSYGDVYKWCVSQGPMGFYNTEWHLAVREYTTEQKLEAATNQVIDFAKVIGKQKDEIESLKAELEKCQSGNRSLADKYDTLAAESRAYRDASTRFFTIIESLK